MGKSKTRHHSRLRMLKIAVVSLIVMLSIIISAKFNKVFAASYAKTIEVKLTDGQDATKEIQAALDAAAKAGTKKKQALVKVPAGTYYISKTLVIGSNTYLKLDKKTYIKKNKNAKDPILHMLHAKQGTKGKYADNARITVEGGVWDAEYILYNSKTSGSVFMFAHTTKLKIINVTMCNSFGTHLLELGGVKDCTVKNCEFYGFKAADDKTQKEAIQLDVCHDSTLLTYGEPYDDTPCQKITITGCNIHDYSRGVGSHIMVEGIYHKNIKITGNTFKDIPKAGIYGYNYVDLTVKDNTMVNVGCGIQLKTDSTEKNTKVSRNKGVKAMSVSGGDFKINLTGNTIKLNEDVSQTDKDYGNSIGIFIYGSDVYPIKNASISNNTISCASSGVYLRYVGSANISGNTLDRFSNTYSSEDTKFAEDAIKLLDSSNATISGNVISGITSTKFENGIALREGCKNVTISSNTINATTKSGLGIYDGSTVSGGSNNTILNSGLNGITVMGSEVTLSDSVIKGVSQHAVSIQQNSKLSLTGCTIRENHGNALQLKEAVIYISGNTFAYNCQDEVDGKAVTVLSGISGEISNNTFYNPNTKSELWISSDASLSPYVSTVKTAKAVGSDAACNTFTYLS